MAPRELCEGSSCRRFGCGCKSVWPVSRLVACGVARKTLARQGLLGFELARSARMLRVGVHLLCRDGARVIKSSVRSNRNSYRTIQTKRQTRRRSSKHEGRAARRSRIASKDANSISKIEGRKPDFEDQDDRTSHATRRMNLQSDHESQLTVRTMQLDGSCRRLTLRRVTSKFNTAVPSS